MFLTNIFVASPETFLFSDFYCENEKDIKIILTNNLLEKFCILKNDLVYTDITKQWNMIKHTL